MADSVARPARNTWRWLVPSLSHVLWLVFVLMLLQPAQREAMVSSDGDTCMHWRVGESMLESGHVVRTDEFSHTRPGQPVISKEWLAEILFAFAGRHGGLFGISVLAALIIATTIALLHGQLVREGNDLLLATGLTLLAAFAASGHWLARPHLFSLFLLLLWNDALRRYERDRNARRLALVLGLLTALWVNLHGGYLAGFLVLGAYWLGAALERDRQKLIALTGIGVLCALVSLLNPSGYELHLHNLAFLRSDYLTGMLGEYRSPNFHAPETRGFLVWLALLFFTLALRRPRVTAAAGVLLISWTYFALYAVRNIPLMVILTAPIVAPSLSEIVRGRLSGLSQRMSKVSACGAGWPVVVAVALLAITRLAGPTEMPAEHWPVDAMQFIKANPDQFRGRKMFNQYAWGGYLMQVLPEHKVFVDGRTDFYGESLLREFNATAGLQTNWVAALDKYQVTWTLMPADHRLNLALALTPGWSCIYTNKVAAMFLKSP